MRRRTRRRTSRRGTRRIRARRTRRTRIGRANSKTARSRFEIDGAVYYTWQRLEDTFVGTARAVTNNTSGAIPAFVDGGAGTGTNALLYRFDFPLDFLSANDRGYTAIGALYDQVRLNRAYIKLINNVNPRSTYAIPLPTAGTPEDFTSAVDYMPDASWIDYDGTPLVYTTAGSTSIPGTGDVTNYLGNRYGLRRHRAFSTIIRSLKPKFVSFASKAIPNPATGGFTIGNLQPIVRSGRPWLPIAAGSLYTGSIFVAISYKGGDAIGGQQPKYNWSARTGYSVSFRSPLFG